MSKSLKTIDTLRERERERATLLNNEKVVASDQRVVHKNVGAASSCPQGKSICAIHRGEKGITLIALIVTILFSYDEKIKCSNSKGFLLTTIL